MNKQRVKWTLLVLAIVVLAMELFQPKHTNPMVIPSRSLESHVTVPESVQSVLQRSCYDCHSNATVWPWYSHVAPVSWMVVDDVNTGRRHINFQDWEAQENEKEAKEHLGLICKEVRTHGMPLFSYRLMHRDARLTDQDVKTLCAWSEPFAADDGAAGGQEHEHHHDHHADDHDSDDHKH
jgi:hypothetical protein